MITITLYDNVTMRIQHKINNTINIICRNIIHTNKNGSQKYLPWKRQ